MCIMDVREGQHHSTIAQAQAHNLGTVVGDLEMFYRLLEKRGDNVKAAEAYALLESVRANYENALGMYASFLSADVAADKPDIAGGMEYHDLVSLVEGVVHRDMKHAHVYETR